MEREYSVGVRDTLELISIHLFLIYYFIDYFIIFSLSLPLQSKDDQIQVIGNLKNISMASSKLLLAAKSLSVDPGAANAKNLLAVAARCDEIQKTRIFLLYCK